MQSCANTLHLQPAGNLLYVDWGRILRAAVTTLCAFLLHVAALLDSEFATQRGTHAVSGTYEGARAVAGSGSNFGEYMC